MDIGLVPMRDSAVPVLGGAHDSDGWDVDTPWHFHDMHQLLHATAGSVDVEGAEGRYRIPHQFAAWIPAGTVHRTRIQKVASGSVFLSPELVPPPVAGSRLRVIRAPALLREMMAHARRWPLAGAEDAARRAYFACMGSLCPNGSPTRSSLSCPQARTRGSSGRWRRPAMPWRRSPWPRSAAKRACPSARCAGASSPKQG
ncbi:MAG TPA: AraC family ligand binding domain-containing protein [Novosphingobium sp.]